MSTALEIVQYFSTLPGSLIHHAVVILLLLVAGGLAILGWRRSPAAGGLWFVVAVGLALAAQLGLFSVGVLAVASTSIPAFVLPPLDRAVAFVSAVAFIWAGALPRNSRGGRLIPAVLVAGALVALSVSWINWASVSGGGAVTYNKSLQETAWEAAKIVLLTLGVIVLIARRAAGWWAGVIMLVILLAGHVLHFRFPPANSDFAGIERLADFAALPFFCLLAFVRTRIPAAPPAMTPTLPVEAPVAPERPVAATEVPLPVPSAAVTLQAPPIRLAEAVAQGPGDEMANEIAELRAALTMAQAENDRLAAELAESHETLERTRRRAEALVEQEHTRLEEASALRADLEAARRKLEAAAELETQLAEVRQEAEEQRARADGLAAELGAAGTKLAEVEGQLEGMRPQLEMLDRLWVNLQVVQKQAEERAAASHDLQPELQAQLEALQQQESLLRAELETAHGELKRAGERLQAQRTELAAARQEARAAQEQAVQLSAKLGKARAKGERMAQQLSESQAAVERHLDEVATLADLNHQQAGDLDRLQAELDEAQAALAQRAEENTGLQGELTAIRQTDGDRIGELERARAELREAQAQLAAQDEARKQLEADLQAARAEAAALPGLQAELAAARQLEAELRHNAEMARAEAARLSAQTETLRLQVELGEKEAAEARAELASAQTHLSEQAGLLARARDEAPDAEWVVAAAAKADRANANGPEAYRHSGNGDARRGDHPPAPPSGASPTDVTLVGGAARVEPERAPSSEILPDGAGANACPRLGTLGDEDTRFTFSSPDHYCYRLDTPAPIEAEHQIAFCLCAGHAQCPILTGEMTHPVTPINTQADAGDGRRRRGRRLGGLLGGRK